MSNTSREFGRLYDDHTSSSFLASLSVNTSDIRCRLVSLSKKRVADRWEYNPVVAHSSTDIMGALQPLVLMWLVPVFPPRCHLQQGTIELGGVPMGGSLPLRWVAFLSLLVVLRGESSVGPVASMLVSRLFLCISSPGPPLPELLAG